MKIILIIVIVLVVLGIIGYIMDKVDDIKDEREQKEWEAYIQTPEGQEELKRIHEREEQRAAEAKAREEARAKEEKEKQNRREDYIRSLDEDCMNCVPLLNHNSDMTVEECYETVYSVEKLTDIYLNNIIAYKNKYKKNGGSIIIKDILTKIEYEPEEQLVVLCAGDGSLISNENQSIYRTVRIQMAMDDRMGFTPEIFSELRLGEEIVALGECNGEERSGFNLSQGILLAADGRFFEPTKKVVIMLYDKLKA